MHIATKFKIGAGICFAAVVFLFLQQSTPEGNQRMTDYVRTMPAWHALIFVGGLLLFFLLGLKIFYWDIPKAGKKVKAEAEQVAKEKWYVQGVAIYGKEAILWLDVKGWRTIQDKSAPQYVGAGHISLSSVDSRQVFKMPIRPAHPSMRELRNLDYLDIIEFEFVEKGMECALETEYCAYLKLKA